MGRITSNRTKANRTIAAASGAQAPSGVSRFNRLRWLSFQRSSRRGLPCRSRQSRNTLARPPSTSDLFRPRLRKPDRL